MLTQAEQIPVEGGGTMQISIVVDKHGDQVLAREDVSRSDVLFARDETWWRGVREGLLPLDLTSLDFHLRLGAKVGERYAGYVVELIGQGCSYSHTFPLTTLENTAHRAVARLIKENLLKLNDEYQYFLGHDRRPQATALRHEQIRVSERHEPLQLAAADLAAYLKRSEVLRTNSPLAAESTGSTENAAEMKIFVAGEVWDRAHQLARRGGEKESAGVWTGRLLQDASTREIFLVLEECIEATAATEEQYSVQLSGESWSQVRNVLQIRRKRLRRPEEMIVGTVHGQNFLPEAVEQGRRMCELCPQRDVCTRTTAQASNTDFQWHKAHFAGQP